MKERRSDRAAPVLLEVIQNVDRDAGISLPAWSRQEPLSAAAGLSGPAYLAEVQESMWDVSSLPRKSTATGWLYQPFASGWRAGEAPVTEGAVASYLSAKVPKPTFPARSRQKPATLVEALSGPP